MEVVCCCFCAFIKAQKITQPIDICHHSANVVIKDYISIFNVSKAKEEKI
tara:strand:- start:1348 stop:1497 length:150 start_codon:yes stop_codon:yes gene_type:complete